MAVYALIVSGALLASIIVYLWFTRERPDPAEVDAAVARHPAGKRRENTWGNTSSPGKGNTPRDSGPAAATTAGTPLPTGTGGGTPRVWPVTRLTVIRPLPPEAYPFARVNPSQDRLATRQELEALAYAGNIQAISSENAAWWAMLQLEEWTGNRSDNIQTEDVHPA